MLSVNKLLIGIVLTVHGSVFGTFTINNNNLPNIVNNNPFDQRIPIVINTWGFTNGTAKAWDTVYSAGRSAVDAVEFGCKVCEEEQCDGTVGFGGSPDENGETTLDAMIMDGESMNVGAVAALRRVKDAISVARHVLDYTRHSLLAGDQATAFAVNMGFKEESLQTSLSKKMWESWKAEKCQPNFWTNVLPNPRDQCGPYTPSNVQPTFKQAEQSVFNEKNHDTIGMVVIDGQGRIAAGTSTNGARNKIMGRVGDSPIPGAGAYADSSVGGAAATGDGDIMLRFLPSFLAVEEMRRGISPVEAGRTAMLRIAAKYPSFVGGIVVVRADGEFGAACHGLQLFHYSVCNKQLKHPTILSVRCE